MGIICEYCYNSSLEKVYNGTSRDAIILVHGLGSSPATFNEIIGDIKLTNQPFQTWIFGYSSQRTIEEISKEFSDLMEAHSNEFDTIYIAAHSLGGLIVQKALYDSYNSQKYTYVGKIKKAILVGVPNEGSVFVNVYEQLYRTLINKAAKYKNVFNINSKLVDNLKDGMIVPRVPGIEYYVIAGTNPYELGKISELKEINETHDGIVTIKSAQRIGDSYINDRCSNYWDVYVTHTQLIDDDVSRKLIERIIAKEILTKTGFENIIGHTKYFELKIVNCESNSKYIVIGKKTAEEFLFDPTLCLCGNDVCGEGENELNCPADCLEKPIDKEIKKVYIIFLIILLIILLIVYYEYKRNKAHPSPKEKITQYEEQKQQEQVLIREDKLKALNNYITNNYIFSLKNGFNKQQFIQILTKNGWPEEISKQAVEEAYKDFSNAYSSLLKYIKKELKKGIDPKIINLALIKNGWCETIIERAFENKDVDPLLKKIEPSLKRKEQRRAH